MHDVAVTYVNDQNANLGIPAESPRRTASPGDMWKCHINSSEHYRDIPLCQPWRQKTWSSPEESDLEDSLAHTSWTLLLIYIPLLTNKTKTPQTHRGSCQRWSSMPKPDLFYVNLIIFLHEGNNMFRTSALGLLQKHLCNVCWYFNCRKRMQHYPTIRGYMI